MHGRSRMTIDPRIPTNTGTEHVGFSPTRQTSLAPSARRREVFGESHEGRELHPTKDRFGAGLSCIWMTESNELICCLWLGDVEQYIYMVSEVKCKGLITTDTDADSMVLFARTDCCAHTGFFLRERVATTKLTSRLVASVHLWVQQG